MTVSDITVKVEDGWLHAESSRVLGIPATRLMEIFGLHAGFQRQTDDRSPACAAPPLTRW